MTIREFKKELVARIESLYRRNLSTECIRTCWKKADQQDMNDEEIMLELIEVQKIISSLYKA